MKNYHVLQLFGAASFVLIVLKLAGIITISWWIVTFPLWIGGAIGGVVVVSGLVLLGVSYLMKD